MLSRPGLPLKIQTAMRAHYKVEMAWLWAPWAFAAPGQVECLASSSVLPCMAQLAAWLRNGTFNNIHVASIPRVETTKLVVVSITADCGRRFLQMKAVKVSIPELLQCFQLPLLHYLRLQL